MRAFFDGAGLRSGQGTGNRSDRYNNDHERRSRGTRDWRQVWAGHPTYWLSQAFFWLGLWLSFWIVSAADSRLRLDEIFLLNHTCLCVFGLVSSHLFRAIYYLRHWSKLAWLMLIPRVILFCVAFACLESFLANWIVSFIVRFPSASPRIPVGPLLMESTQTALTLVAWSAIYLGYQYQRQLQESKIEQLNLTA